MEPALVAVAHGSRDPRSAATVARLMDEVRRQRPDLDVRLSFLGLSAPRLPEVLAAVADTHRRAVVVPLLLGHAFHARVDVPGEVARAARRHPGLDIAVAPVLGGDARLEEAAVARLGAAAGPLRDPGLGVVVAAIGSSHAPANAVVRDIAARWATRFGWSGAQAAFATATTPTVADAVAALRAGGAQRIAVAPWILAPGLLPDRIVRDALAADPGALVAGPLAAHPVVASLVVDRWAQRAGGCRCSRPDVCATRTGPFGRMSPYDRTFAATSCIADDGLFRPVPRLTMSG